MLEEHLDALGSQQPIGCHQGQVAGDENGSRALDGLLVDLTDAYHVELHATEEASNDFTKGVSPDEWLHGKSDDGPVGSLIKALLSEHDHHNDSRTVCPKVYDYLVKTTVLSIANAAPLVYEVANRVELCVLFDGKDHWKLKNGDLQAL